MFDGQNFRTFADKIQEEFMRVKALVLFVVTLAFAASAWAPVPTLFSTTSALRPAAWTATNPMAPWLPTPRVHLYGTTYYGGTNNYGEVFELTNSGGTWTETVIYSFLGPSNSDGANPFGGLVFDSTGNLYGTTYDGGPSNQGTVFELAKSGSTWKETVLHSFDDISGNDGY